MFGYDNIELFFSFSPWYLAAGFLLVVLYSVYVYRYTIPRVSPLYKLFLTSLRSAALILILLVIFEPVAELTKENISRAVNLVFIDNSRSVTAADSSDRAGAIDELIGNLSDEVTGTRLYTFSSEVDTSGVNTSDELTFAGPLTNFRNIVSFIKEYEGNPVSATIISDGIITEGSDPVYEAEKLGLPVYTMAVGDTTARKDVRIKKVAFNDYVYVERTTEIKAVIFNNGFEGQKATASLYEENEVVSSQNLELSGSGTNNVSFEYTPETPGEKRMSVSVTTFPGEVSTENNRNVFFLNVLDNQLSVLLVSGSPSPDLAALSSTLALDENIKTRTLAQLSETKYTISNRAAALDSADILFLVNFPGSESSSEFTNEVMSRITEQNKPFFVLAGPETDIQKLKNLTGNMPFNIGEISAGSRQVQAAEAAGSHPLTESLGNAPGGLTGLPPLFRNNSRFGVKSGSETLLETSEQGMKEPLLVIRSAGQSRSAALLGSGIYRWKLKLRESIVFESFVLNLVKWLNTSDDAGRVNIRTSKRLYVQGEDIEFTGSVYNESLEPVNGAEVRVNIAGEGFEESIRLVPSGNGLYEGNYPPLKPGNYNFTADASLDGKKLGTDESKFSVGETDIEKMDLQADAGFMKNLARITGGEYYFINQAGQLPAALNRLSEGAEKTETKTAEFRLWSSEWLLVIIVLLLALEWFFRKRAGML